MVFRLHGFRKALQQGCYTFLNSRSGAFVLLLALVLTLNSLLHLIDEHLGTTFVCPRGSCTVDWGDNVGEKSMEDVMCTEPIDAVYTWVNGSDPRHIAEVKYWQKVERRKENQTLRESEIVNSTEAPATFAPRGPSPANEEELGDVADQQASRSRFEDHDEMLYSLRSLVMFAPWIRRVYIVTNGQVPTWLNLEDPRISVVPHSSLFPNKSHLPVFSSPAIEAHLHRIPGLSRRFLYFNDDTFFAAPVHPSDFYTKAKGHRIYFSWPVPNCNEGCPSTWLADGFCDNNCNTTDCDWDGGDCVGDNVRKTVPNYNYGRQQPGGQTAGAHQQTANSWCSSTCADSWIGDKYCDQACETEACGFDATDCGIEKYQQGPYEKLANFSLQHVREHLEINETTRAIFINLTKFFPSGQTKILDGYHDSPSWIRTSTISQLRKVMVITLKNDADSYENRVRFEVEGRWNKDEEHDFWGPIVVHFNITRRRPAPRAPSMLSESMSTKSQTVIIDSADGRDVVPLDAPILKGVGASLHEDGRAALDSVLLKHRARREDHRVRLVETKRKLTFIDHHSGDSVVNVAEEQITREPIRVLKRKPLTPERMAEIAVIKHRLLDKEIELQESALREEHDWNRAFKSFLLNPAEGLNRSEAKADARRQLLDMFGDSLKFGNRLITKKFGTGSRKVPSHMVHFIDKRVIEELWELWPEEWEQSSAARFRSATNMQYAFLHMYYIIHAYKEWGDGKQFFDEMMDMNGNGVIDESEYRRVALLLWEKEVPEDELRAFIATPQLESELLPTLTATITDGAAAGDTPSRSLSQTRSKVFGSRTASESISLPHSASSTSTLRVPKVVPTLSRSLVPNVPSANKPQGDQTIAPTAKGPAPSVPPAFRPPNPDDNIRVLNNRYLAVVSQLIEMTANGTIAGGRRLPPAWTGKLDAAHFADSVLSMIMQKRYEKDRKKYLHDLVPDESDITFFMIRDNSTIVQHNMDHVLYKRAKFLCINDNMNHSHPEYPAVVDAIQGLLRRYYPEPSRFELPNGRRNPFTYLDEVDEKSSFASASRTFQQLSAWAATLAPGSLISNPSVSVRDPGAFGALRYDGVRAVYPLYLSALIVVIAILCCRSWCCRKGRGPRRRQPAEGAAAVTPAAHFL